MIWGGSSVRDGTAASAELRHAPVLRIGGLSTPDQWHIGRTDESNDLREDAMQITKNTIETAAGPSEWFTGAVYVDAVAAPSGPSRLQASSVHFTPGARTAWHTHPNGQTIYVTEGVGLAQRRGGSIEVICPGDRVFFEPGEDHWHGAAPNRFMTHLAMQEVDDQGSPVTWVSTSATRSTAPHHPSTADEAPPRRPEGVKMLEGKPTPAGSDHATAAYSYPGDLARFVRDRWRAVPDPPAGVDPLPDAAALEGFFATCYQASMLREEERPVIFRAILAEPALFDPEGRPPEDLQRLEFPRSLPFDPRELRRLSVAADPQRTLIGVWRDREGGLQIWGLINSGTRWLRDIHGGRRAGEPRGVQGPRARRQAPGGKALGVADGPLRVGMAAGPVLPAPGGACGAAQGRPEPRGRALGREVGAAGADGSAQDHAAYDEARHKRAARGTPRRNSDLYPPREYRRTLPRAPLHRPQIPFRGQPGPT